MSKITLLVCVLSLLLLNIPSAIAESWIYEDGGKSDTGIILCHGRGGDPESWVVEPLRTAIHEQLGYHTLSLQMPGGRKKLADYEADFPLAYAEIDRGVRFLRSRGVTRIVLIGHSLGSRMATAYLASSPAPPFYGFVGVGMLNNGGFPFSCLDNLQKTTLPVLDIWGEAGMAQDAHFADERKILVAPRYIQIGIADGDHALSAHEEELIRAVIHWLQTVL